MASVLRCGFVGSLILAGTWFYGKSKKIDSMIESPGISFVGMTQLSTFVPKVFYNMMGSGRLFDRRLIVLNLNLSRLMPSAQAEKNSGVKSVRRTRSEVG